MIGGKKIEQPKLAKHDSSVLDLAFVMDCTGSMGSYIENARESIRKIVEEIVGFEKSNVKLALVEYRDHPPQEESFVTSSHDFTESVAVMKGWLDQCSAVGGGDEPEAVADGLDAALNLSWRENATKICILISDAPPHGIKCHGDSMPNGCPKGIDPILTVDKLAKKGVTLYSVGCEPSILPYKEFFSALAFKTGGQYVPLRNANLLAKVIVGGAVEEISLEKLMIDVKEEIETQRAQGIVDEKVLADAVQCKLKSKGVKTNQMMYNDSKIEGPSDAAKKYSKMANLEELRNNYEPSAGQYEQHSMAYGAVYDAPMAYSTASRKMRPMMTLDAAAPMPLAAAPGAHAPVESYTVTNSDITYEQTERLVQKALNRS